MKKLLLALKTLVLGILVIFITQIYLNDTLVNKIEVTEVRTNMYGIPCKPYIAIISLNKNNVILDTNIIQSK